MTFWLRHFVLIACCVVLPFGAALYFDTRAEIERTREAGARAAEVALAGLDAHFELRTMSEIEETRDVGQRLVEDRSLRELFRSTEGDEARVRSTALIEDHLTPGGFGLVLDDEGTVVFAAGESEGIGRVESFAGHPIFVKSQLGYAFDTLWTDDRTIHLLTAAPLVESGVASGAVVRARPIDAGWLRLVGRSLQAYLSLHDEQGVVVSTLPPDAADALEQAAGPREAAPVSFGELENPITASNAPFLPLFVEHRGSGLGFTARISKIPNTNLAWSVAVRSGEGLAELGERQAIVFAVMLASIMLAILIGLINARTFIRPLGRIESHLSEIQMGRGDIELPEVRVSRPYRRLVRLINMTVQKLPARRPGSVGATTPRYDSDVGSADLRSAREAPAPREPSRDVASDLFEPSLGTGTGSLPSPPAATESPTPPPRPHEANEPPPAVPESPDFSGNLEAPLARAIEEMQDPDAPFQTQPLPSRRSASDVRGGLPRLGSEDLVAPPPDLPPPSLDLGAAGISAPPSDAAPPPTVVAPVADDLLARSSREEFTDHGPAEVPRDITSVGPEPMSPAEEALEPAERAHFREVYERFIELRRQCGEPTTDLSFERFLAKLTKNRDTLVQKYNCRTVRFQVYEKDGKAALKATPVRAR